MRIGRPEKSWARAGSSCSAAKVAPASSASAPFRRLPDVLIGSSRVLARTAAASGSAEEVSAPGRAGIQALRSGARRFRVGRRGRVPGYGVTDFAQAAMSGLLASVRARQVADRSVGKVATILVGPQ